MPGAPCVDSAVTCKAALNQEWRLEMGHRVEPPEPAALRRGSRNTGKELEGDLREELCVPRENDWPGIRVVATKS